MRWYLILCLIIIVLIIVVSAVYAIMSYYKIETIPKFDVNTLKRIETIATTIEDYALQKIQDEQCSTMNLYGFGKNKLLPNIDLMGQTYSVSQIYNTSLLVAYSWDYYCGTNDTSEIDKILAPISFFKPINSNSINLGVVFQDASHYYIALNSGYNKITIVDDLEIQPTAYGNRFGEIVSSGIYKMDLIIIDILKTMNLSTDKTMILCGHSTGGDVIALLADYFVDAGYKTKFFSTATVKMGNTALMTRLNNIPHVVVVNIDDPYIYLPPSNSYVNFIDPETILFNKGVGSANHHLYNYLDFFRSQLTFNS